MDGPTPRRQLHAPLSINLDPSKEPYPQTGPFLTGVLGDPYSFWVLVINGYEAPHNPNVTWEVGVTFHNREAIVGGLIQAIPTHQTYRLTLRRNDRLGEITLTLPVTDARIEIVGGRTLVHVTIDVDQAKQSGDLGLNPLPSVSLLPLILPPPGTDPDRG